jgi:hypothetical protein
MECAADAAPISWKGAILAIKNPLMQQSIGAEQTHQIV